MAVMYENIFCSYFIYLHMIVGKERGGVNNVENGGVGEEC